MRQRAPLESHHRVSARHASRNERAEILPTCAVVQESVPHKGDEVEELGPLQIDRSRQNRIDLLEDGLDRSEPSSEVVIDTGCGGMVAAKVGFHSCRVA